MAAEAVNQANLLQGLNADERDRFLALGRPQSFSKDESLFLLGDNADRLYVVITGKVALCIPIQVSDTFKDISVEEAGPGETLGWSALVKPYRFTRSARAAEASEVIAFTRRELLEFFETQPRIGYIVLTRISELVGLRLLKMRALWARTLQRVISQEASRETK